MPHPDAHVLDKLCLFIYHAF